jgi:hypothetical protein
MTEKTRRVAVMPRMITRISSSIYRKRGDISNGVNVWKSPAFIGYCTKQGIPTPSDRPTPMAKTKYTFEKRQRDLAKKKKKEEKLARKLERKAEKAPETAVDENGVPIEPAPDDTAADAGTETGGES